MRRLRRYFLVTTLLLGGLLCGSVTGLSLAHPARVPTIGPLPPAHPRSDCRGRGLAAIDACRARDGVGPLLLPSNWARLSPDAQLLVVIDLERVNRGLAPIPAIVKPLNALAQRGAFTGGDPTFPRCACFRSGGGIWASADPPSVLEADELWMYDDAGSDWGHRANILMAGTGLIGGAGATRDDWAFEMLAGYHYRPSAVTFRWSTELAHFARRPGPEARGGQRPARRNRDL